MNDGKETNGRISKLMRQNKSQANRAATRQHEALDILPKAGGVLMIGVFIINVYIGLFDKTLAQYNPTHLYANWTIAVVDLAAAVILLSRLSHNIRWTILSGIAWPLVYILSLAVDIETDLGKPNLWPTPVASYQYLILGDPAQGWVLWKYTIPTAIFLLIIIAALSAISVSYVMRNRRKTSDLNKGTITATKEETTARTRI